MSNATLSPARLNRGTPVGVNGVTKQYGNRTILNHIDLHIPAGQFVAVVGRSGCGKVPCCACWPGWNPPRTVNCWRATRRWPRRAKIPA